MADGTSSNVLPSGVAVSPGLGWPENSKLTYDEQLDNRREVLARSRAWEDLAIRKAQNAATFDHAMNTIQAISAQAGLTEAQQTVSPEDTATSEAIKGGVGVSAEQVAANVADLATSLIPVIVSSLATAISTALAALLPVTVTAAGGASTPSQTSTKSIT